MSKKQQLPENWSWSTIGDICKHPQYGWTTKALSSGSVKLLRTTDITSGKINWERVPFCYEAPSDLEKYLLRDGDIVVSRAGSVGVSHLVTNPELAVFASYLIRFNPYINRQYVYYFLQSPAYWNEISDKSSGIAVQNVNASKLKCFDIPIAPLQIQAKVVEKIEELFSHIDAGIKGLKQSKAKLQQYRQSVLKDAVTGKLTETWREQNADKLEPANELLERILEERRSNWEAEQLKIFEEKGKTPKDDKWKGKYKTPILPNEKVKVNFPENWEVVSPDMIFASVTDGDHQAPPKAENGIPFLVIGDVKTGQVNIGDKRFVPREYYDAIKLERRPTKGDLLYTVVGSYGIPVKVESEIEFCVQRHIAILKPSTGINRDFYFHLFKSGLVYSQASDVATGTAQKTVSLGGLRSFKIPLPSAEEQLVISNLVSEKLESSFRTETTIDGKIVHSASLKSSILADAFSGKLVDNIEADETAEQLLEKIQAEKQQLEEKAKLAKKKPKARAKKMKKRPIIDVLKESKKALKVEQLFELAGFSEEVSPDGKKAITPDGIETFYQELKIVAENDNVDVTPIILDGQKQGDRFEYKEVKANEAG